MGVRVYDPHFWYEGTKGELGPNTITINYQCKIKKEEYDTDCHQEWWFYSSYYDEDYEHWYNYSVSHITGDDFNFSGTVNVSIVNGCKNRIYCLGYIYYVQKIPTEGPFGPTTTTNIVNIAGEVDEEYGGMASKGAIPIDSTKTKITQLISNNVLIDDNYYGGRADVIQFYPKNNANANDFWINHETNEAIAPTCFIHKHITVDNVDQWITQLGIWKSWAEQKNKYNTGNDLRVQSNTPIKAEWYNKCANACGAGTVNGGANGTVITADHFKALAQKVTTWT